jgi:hypothetical protein
VHALSVLCSALLQPLLLTELMLMRVRACKRFVHQPRDLLHVVTCEPVVVESMTFCCTPAGWGWGLTVYCMLLPSLFEPD